jgi:hypothetical protein
VREGANADASTFMGIGEWLMTGGGDDAAVASNKAQTNCIGAKPIAS